mgnify:CR=1 FL=1
MSIYKASLSGLVFAMSVSISAAVAESRWDINSAYDATGIAHQPTGKFADASMSSGRVTPQGDILTPQAVSAPTSLLIESTLSRQLYNSAGCSVLNGVKWPSYVTIFSAIITPQNLSTAAGLNVVEVNFTTQVSIVAAATVPGVGTDGVSLTCLVEQPPGSGNSVPCSNTAVGPFLLRQGQNISEKSRLIMTSYLGYAQIDHTEPVKVTIGLSTINGTNATTCFNNLILRTR